MGIWTLKTHIQLLIHIQPLEQVDNKNMKLRILKVPLEHGEVYIGCHGVYIGDKH